MQLIGQDNLINKIDQLNLDTFPRSLILNGDYGSGKHSLCNYISEHLNIEIEDISENISLDTVERINLEIVPKIYLIDSKLITEKNEATLLKLVEEPLKNAYIIILSEAINKLLETINNRCIIWNLNEYSENDLLLFYNNCANDNNHNEEQKKLVFRIANTPGKMNAWNNQPAVEIYNLCNTILDKVHAAAFFNTLTLVNKIDLDWSDITKYNDKFFFEVLLLCARDRVIKNKEKIDVERYNLTNKLLNDLTIFNINKKQLFEHYLYELKVLG